MLCCAGRRLPVTHERVERRNRNKTTVDFEMLAQRLARIRATVAVRAERHETARHPALYLVGHDLHVIRCGDVRPRPVGEALLQVALAGFLVRVQLVPSLHLERIAAQFIEARYRPNVARDAEILVKQFGRAEDLALKISRDIGVRLTLKTWPPVTHKIDPDIDEAMYALIEDLLFSQQLAKIGYVKGVGASTRSNPRKNLTGDPYFTSGYRVVLMIDRRPYSFEDLQTFNWENPISERIKRLTTDPQRDFDEQR